ncbi:uncharacterized protein LOC103828044 isoform X2 [Brassica rapa]|uniref:uncharacterized protein LOC103828044 isoform X2 n=1 Tax=Brassica campestris TaxID=3711 RepID=UPI00142E74EA|nr:uncharacterized protein LOC103828044 isoform X2 [Brassica rapa]
MSLAQSSVALPGFVDAIQLVFMAAVPQIKEVVTPVEPVVVIDSDSDSDSGDSESLADKVEMSKPPNALPASVRYCVNPAHVRDLHEECKVEVTSMLVDGTHTAEELTWEDEVDDVTVDNLVRSIEQGHVLTKAMFSGGLSASDLARMRSEKKLKEKEQKDNKERENQADSPEGEIGEAYDVSHMANLVGRIVTPKIEDTVYKLGDKLEERLAKLIKAEVLNMQGAVIQSIIGLLGKPNPSAGVASDENGGAVDQAQNGRGCTSAGASLLTADAIRSEGQTTTTYVPTSLHNSTEQPLVDLATVIPKQAEKVGEPLQAEKVGEPIQLDNLINMVITDVGGVLDDSEVAPANNHPSIHITVGPVAEGVKTLEDAAHSPTDTDLTTPQPGQNTNFIHHHLSPVDEDGSPHEKEGELLHEEVCHASVPDVEASNVIAETRKSKRTRILPPLFNDYQCDPKIKAFSREGTLTTTSNNIDEIYMAMRERAGDSRVYTVANGMSVTTDELNEIVDRNQQMTPKVMDVLMYYISLDRNRKGSHQSKIAFYDTNFPALLMKQHGRLTKTAIKDRHRMKYDEAVVKHFIGGSTPDDVYDCIYFPFFIDKQHWVGVSLDLSRGAVQILDCNHGFRSESMMKKDFTPITVVVPHILATSTGNKSADARKPYQMVRVNCVPHNSNSTDAGATTVLLIQAHAANGADGCKDVTPETISSGAKHLAVLVYRDITHV